MLNIFSITKKHFRMSLFIIVFFALFFGGQNVKAAATELTNCCMITGSAMGEIVAKICRLEKDFPCRGFIKDVGKFGISGEVKEERVVCGEEFLCYKNQDIRKTLQAVGELMAAKCDQYETVNTCNTGEAIEYCFWSYRLGECVSRISGGVCPYLSEPECKESRECKWENEVCQTPLQSELEKIYGARDTGILPPCTAFGTCTDVNQILETVVNFTREVFKYVGALAFVFFIYGGGLMVFSFGNAEKFKKGQSVLVAAVIGLIITFSASFMVGFLLDLLGAK